MKANLMHPNTQRLRDSPSLRGADQKRPSVPLSRGSREAPVPDAWRRGRIGRADRRAPRPLQARVLDKRGGGPAPRRARTPGEILRRTYASSSADIRAGGDDVNYAGQLWNELKED